ncbi:MAG: DUF4825 domain-containing protein, partial [Clostridia bacterium]|nr:DUF4825 domain-containing protein [Clostridia bacterium]
TTEKNTGLHILAYKKQGEEAELSNWYYVQVSEDASRLFTYYQAPDGSYIYDNDPKIIKQFTKESAPEEGYTRYLADGLLLLEKTYNQYTENKEALLEEGQAQAKDENAVSNLVTKALPVGVKLDSAAFSSKENPNDLKIGYTLADQNRYVKSGVLEEAAFYQNALVLFSLMENVDVITMDIKSPDDSYKLTYRRNAAEKQFENKDISEFAKTEESFEAFVEEIPQMTPPPAAAEDSSGKTSGAKIIKTKTFTVGSGSQLTHPETGKLVTVDKYAERYRVSQYLDRPITVQVFEQIVDGKTKLWAQATCEGAYIASYPFASYEEMESMFAMLP